MILSKADLQTLLGDQAGEYSDPQLEHAAAAGSAAVEQYCNREFLLAIRREWVTGSGEQTLVLDSYPVRSIFRISTSVGVVGRLANSQSVYQITAQVKPDAIVLTTATAGGIDIRTVEYSSLPVATLDDLAAVLAAQVPPWWSLEVLKSDSVYALTPDVYSGTGNIEIQGAASWDAIAGYSLDGRVLRSATRWPRRVYIEYEAGYAQADIPGPVRQAALQMAKTALDSTAHGSGIKSETIGDYKYEMFDTSGRVDMPGSVTSLLEPYRNLRL